MLEFLLAEGGPVVRARFGRAGWFPLEKNSSGERPQTSPKERRRGGSTEHITEELQQKRRTREDEVWEDFDKLHEVMGLDKKEGWTASPKRYGTSMKATKPRPRTWKLTLKIWRLGPKNSDGQKLKTIPLPGTEEIYGSVIQEDVKAEDKTRH